MPWVFFSFFESIYTPLWRTICQSYTWVLFSMRPCQPQTLTQNRYIYVCKAAYVAGDTCTFCTRTLRQCWSSFIQLSLAPYTQRRWDKTIINISRRKGVFLPIIFGCRHGEYNLTDQLPTSAYYTASSQYLHLPHRRLRNIKIVFAATDSLWKVTLSR